MGIWPFTRSDTHAQAEALLTVVQGAARDPELYGPDRVPDTLEGRFEAMTVFAALALVRLRSDPSASGLAQLFTDKLFRLFDAGLREAGVGDLTVPKRMRRLAGDFYGRLEAYAGPVREGDQTALSVAFQRNISVPEAFADELAAHVIARAQEQAGAPLKQLFAAQSWVASAA